MGIWRAIYGPKHNQIKLRIRDQASWESVLKQLRHMSKTARNSHASAIRIEARYSTFEREGTPDIVSKSTRKEKEKRQEVRRGQVRDPNAITDDSEMSSQCSSPPKLRDSVTSRALKAHSRQQTIARN